MFRRILNLFRGFIGLFVSGLERRNPEALLEVEKENLRKQVAQFNQGLASHAAVCERLKVQVKKLETEEQEHRAKTQANLKAGNRDAAAQYALRLQTTTKELAESRKQAEEAEDTYAKLVRTRDAAVQAATAKIEALKHGLDDLKIKKATAALAETSSGMISNIGGSGDNLDRLASMVEEEREKAAGKARVARDVLGIHGSDMKEAERNALAEQALADFAAREGIALNGGHGHDAPVDAPAKSMGPLAEGR